MKTDLTRICAVLLGLVVFAAAQDLSPTLFGTKAPLLLVFGCLAGVPAAIGAGLFADALGGLPFGCSAVFFALAALLVRAAKRAPLTSGKDLKRKRLGTAVRRPCFRTGLKTKAIRIIKKLQFAP